MRTFRWLIATFALAIVVIGASRALSRPDVVPPSKTPAANASAKAEAATPPFPSAQTDATQSLPAPVVAPGSTTRPKSVRVAAVQCAARMGKITHNRQMLSDLVTAAVAQQAKIIVLPECALQGYMAPHSNQVWSTSDDVENSLPVKSIAETVPGSSTKHFAALAKQYGVYIALPLIEEHSGSFYNSLVLLDPDGNIAAHHRKQALWPPGDATWASKGELPAQVVSTRYGRLGLMICYDLHEMPKQLKKAGAEIVLYAVGWFGPNTENWYRDLFPRRYVIPNEFAVVAANWSAESRDALFEGAGFSCVIDRNGVVLAMAKDRIGSEIVIADLPVSDRNTPKNSEPSDE